MHTVGRALFHIDFKSLAFLVYLIGGLIASSNVTVFISIVSLLATDFLGDQRMSSAGW
mgnify:FL=1